MATKHEIKKFIEVRKKEALSRLKDTHKSDIDAVNQKFLAEYHVLIESIKKELSSATNYFDRLIEAASKSGITYQNNYYSNPMIYINNAYSGLSDDEVVRYFDIPAINKLKSKHEKQIDETKHEYDRLIAVTQNMSAKDGIKLLQNLGFNTEELEAVKETTALTINIDAKKLFVTKEEN